MTVSQRMFKSDLKFGMALGGFASDGVAYLSPEMAPRRARCVEEESE
jgi:hypothetical protein